jgi:hypothetical protein
MDLAKIIVKTEPSKHRKPEEKTTKDSKNNTHTEYIMKVSDNIISIVKHHINSRVRQQDTSKTTYCKKKNKTFCS